MNSTSASPDDDARRLAAYGVALLTVLPIACATGVYFANLNIILGVSLMFVATTAIAYFCIRKAGSAQAKWTIESAFEICAVTSLVASVTAAIPIYDQTAMERQREAVLEHMSQLRMAPQKCGSAADRDRIERFRMAAELNSLRSDAAGEWRETREMLQTRLRSCEDPPAALSSLVRSMNAYTKALSDHQSYGAVRSSLSILNDIKVSVFFTVFVIFYLCHSIFLKIIKAAWIGRPS
jgi:hypothetical protein